MIRVVNGGLGEAERYLRRGLLKGANDHPPCGVAAPVPLHLDRSAREHVEMSRDSMDQDDQNGHVRVPRNSALRLALRRHPRNDQVGQILDSCTA